MPTYTYRCNNCDYQFDIKQRMADDPLTDCPECDAENSLRKVLNSVGIVFKGSGFYVTDSRGKSSTAVPRANGKASENGTSANGASANGSSAPKEAESTSTPASTSNSSSKADSSANGSGKGKSEKTAV